MDPAFLGPWVGSAAQVWSRIERETSTALSTEAGIVELSAPVGADAAPGALWVTHAEHLPELVQLPAGTATLPPIIEVRHAEGTRVRVVDGDGRPLEGARVLQWTPIPGDQRADLFTPQARRLLRRGFDTDADGLARIDAWDGPLAVSASLGGLASEVWIGESRARIELTLQPTFQVAGRVTIVEGSLEGAPRVVCSSVVGTQLQELAVLPVAGGAFGARLPLVSDEGYAFRLEGWNVEVQVAVVEPPEPGATVQVDFEARAGHDVWTAVEDQEAGPIEGATVTLRWRQPDGVQVEASGISNAEGYAGVRGVPAGTVQRSAEAPGFAEHVSGPYPVPSVPPQTVVLALVPGWEIEGTVVRDGEPVEDFEVVSWDYSASDHAIARFREREHGEFSVLAEERRITRLFATASGSGPSEVAVVQPGDSTPLRLELTELVRGRGRVVSASSGDPLPGAVFQAFVPGEGEAVAPIARPRPVRADGSFDELAFLRGRGTTRFEAPGHAVQWVDSMGVEGGEIDFGSIALTERQDLTVRIRSEGGFDPTTYDLGGTGVEPLPQRPFPPSGELVLEGVSPGLYCLELRGPKKIDFWITLEPGAVWELELPVGGERVLVVEVDPGEMSRDTLMLRAHLPGPSALGRRVLQQFIDVPLEGEVELSGFGSGGYSLFLLDRSGAELATTSGELEEGELVTSALLGPPSRARSVRVTTPSGEPIDGGSVLVWEPATGVLAHCDLDEQGQGALRGLDEAGSYLARIVHPVLGSQFGIPVAFPAQAEEPVRLVFAPDRAVEVELLDGSTPLVGVHCQLLDGREAFDIASATTDETGRARWTALGPGSYALRIRHPEVWATTASVESEPPGTVTTLQVRRIGSLTIELTSASGQVAGRALELSSLELGADVAGWLAEGRVATSTGALRTDEAGELSIIGLPRGEYAWSVGGSSGVLVVQPGTTTDARITAP